MQRSQRYFLHLSYDGRSFRGWQRQPEQATVQSAVEQMIGQQVGYRVHVHGCGRTDAGVHASQFVAHVDLDRTISAAQLPGVKLHDVQHVAGNLHAQRDVSWRTYTYLIHLDDRPTWRGLSSRMYAERSPLQRLKELGVMIEKIIDFKAFCRQPNTYKHTQCQVQALAWDEFANGSVLRFQITANRFLRGMVRLLVQRQWEAALETRSLSSFRRLLDGRAERDSGRGAYPDGLYLSRVEYAEIDFPLRSHPHFRQIDQFFATC